MVNFYVLKFFKISGLIIALTFLLIAFIMVSSEITKIHPIAILTIFIPTLFSTMLVIIFIYLFKTSDWEAIAFIIYFIIFAVFFFWIKMNGEYSSFAFIRKLTQFLDSWGETGYLLVFFIPTMPIFARISFFLYLRKNKLRKK